MYLTDPFKHFNPKTGDVPQFFTHKFTIIAERARELLKARSKPQIRAAWEAIQWMSHDAKIQKLIWAQLTREAEAIDNDQFLRDNSVTYSDVACLIACRELLNVGDYKKFPNGTWPEYFAVLALAHIGLACADEHHNRKRKSFESEDIYENLLRDLEGHWAINAMEAITAAEWIKREELLQSTQSSRILDEHKKRTSLQASAAAIVRHSKSAALKADFIKFKLAHPDLSTAAVARRFIETLTGERRRILQPTNAVRTLTNAWTTYQKERSPSMRHEPCTDV